MNLLKELKERRIVLIIAQESKFKKTVNEAVLQLSNSGNNIGYITLTTPYDTLVEELCKAKIKLRNFYFVDGITAMAKTPPLISNCIFLSGLSSLTELRVAFSSLIEEKNQDIVFVDRISALSGHVEESDVIKLVHTLVLNANTYQKKAVFVVSREEAEPYLKDLSMFADKVINA